MTEPISLGNSLRVGMVALLQVIAPAIVIVVALAITTSVAGVDFDRYLRAMAAISVALSFVLLQVRRDAMPLTMGSPVKLVVNQIAGWIALLVIIYLVGHVTQLADEYSPGIVVGWSILVPILLIPVTLLLLLLRRRVSVSSVNVRQAVFAGFTAHSRALAEQLRKHPELGTVVRGFFDDRSANRLGPLSEFSLLGELSNVPDYVRSNRIDVIFIALPIRHMERVASLIDQLHDTTASIYYVPDIYVFDLIQSRSAEVMGIPVISLCETPFYGLRGVMKRVTDIIFTLCLLVPALPVMLVIAAIIRLTSPGPVIFRQRRYGLDGHEITVYKFRSMSVTEDGSKIEQVSRHDSRVTPVGRILRKFSLDEIPQLLNVLQGRMSLVGPRPHAVAHNEQYRSLIKGYMLRHKVLPGITGLAQVNGCRGETRSIEEMQARVNYDLEYLRRWTPLLDLKILFLTAVRVFHDSQAY